MKQLDRKLENNMKQTCVSKLIGLVLLTAATNQFATAADSDSKELNRTDLARTDSGWYIGGNLGRSYADIDKDEISSNLLTSGFATTAFDADEKDTGYKLFGGYQFNKYIAVEGGYFTLGEFDFSATTQPLGTLEGKVELEGMNFDLVGMMPLSDRFSLIGRVGTQYTEAQTRFASTGAINVTNSGAEQSDTNYKVGLGLQYALTRSLDVRLEFERFRINDTAGNTGDIDQISAGVVYRFGQSSRPAPKSTPKPAPTPEPMLVVVPATQEYCSILDIQFEVNRDEVELEDQEKFAAVGRFMNKYPDTTAVIEGHTDSVGATENNIELSGQRAQHMVNYLVKHHTINRSRLKSIGYGSTRPLADNSTDAGKRLNRRIHAIISCVEDTEGLEPAGARMTMALQMEFDTNLAKVKPEYHARLEKVARFMRKHPGVNATVEGHTSNQQDRTVEQAMQLSRLRAENVMTYLATQLGIERSRLSSEGFGNKRRVAYNTSAEGQLENQRGNIIFTYK